ncbi:MAG: hypothetical protein WC966_12085 [Bradymonadales bacterium]
MDDSSIIQKLLSLGNCIDEHAPDDLSAYRCHLGAWKCAKEHCPCGEEQCQKAAYCVANKWCAAQ